jgi:ABC-type uncharacterized transport system substrate-binding protein
MLTGISKHAAIASLAACLAIIASSPLPGHPHVWITVESEVLFDEHRFITGIRYKWTFDDVYSIMAVQGLDSDHDGTLIPDELSGLAEESVSSLKEFNFFTFASSPGKMPEPLPPVDYWVEYRDSLLTLHFTLPLTRPVDFPHVKDFSFAIYDPTLYVDLQLAERGPVRLAGAPAGCVPRLTDPAPLPPPSFGQTIMNILRPESRLAAQHAKVISIDCPPS